MIPRGIGGNRGYFTPRWRNDRFRKSVRFAVDRPSRPKPRKTESLVVVMAPWSKFSPKAFWLRVQLFWFGPEPAGGPPTVQPPRSVSNDVDAVTAPFVSTRTLSRKTPRPWVPQSDM